jgi:hypothetical protein
MVYHNKALTSIDESLTASFRKETTSYNIGLVFKVKNLKEAIKYFEKV